MPPVPKFERTYTDIAADTGFYDPANVDDQDAAQPRFDGQIGRKKAQSVYDGRKNRDILNPQQGTTESPKRRGKFQETSSRTSNVSGFIPYGHESHYTVFDTDQVIQKERDTQTYIQTGSQPEVSQAQMFMSPTMQISPLPGSSTAQPTVEPLRTPNASDWGASFPSARLPAPESQFKQQSDYHKRRYLDPTRPPSPPDIPRNPKVNRQRRRSSRIPSYMSQMDNIDERGRRSVSPQNVGHTVASLSSATAASDRESSSAYKVPRERTKYTISEDCTMNASKRRRLCLSALEQPSTKLTHRYSSAEHMNRKAHEERLNARSLTFKSAYADSVAVMELFRKRGNLDNLSELHAGENAKKHVAPLLTCSFCGKTFTRNFHRKNHELTHRRERPHECPTCGHAFTRLKDLKRHEKLHERSPSEPVSKSPGSPLSPEPHMKFGFAHYDPTPPRQLHLQQ